MSLHLLLALCLPSAAPPSPRVDAVGDPLPAGALARMGTSRLRGKGYISAAVFSPDGNTLVTATFGNEVTFWDVRSGRRIRSVELPNVLAVSALGFSQDGKILAACGRGDGMFVSILDPRTGATIRQWRDANRYPLFRLALSPDGRTLVVQTAPFLVGDGRHFTVWDVKTGRLRYAIDAPDQTIQSGPAFLPGGKSFVAQLADGKLHLMNTADGKSARDLEPGVKGLDTEVDAAQRQMQQQRRLSFALTPDGKQVVYCVFGESAGRIADLASGKVVRELAETEKTGCGTPIAVATDNRTLFAETEDGIRVWDLASGKLQRKLPVRYCNTVSPDGKTIVQSKGHAVWIWDVATGKRLHDIGCSLPARELAFSPDGGRLVSLDSGSWIDDLAASEQEGGGIHTWDVASGKELARLYSPDTPQGNDPDPQFRYDGKAVYWVGYRSALYQWKHQTTKANRLTPPQQDREGLLRETVSPTGDVFARLLRSGDDQILSLAHRLRKGERTLTVLEDYRPSSVRLRFSPDGRRLAVAINKRQAVTVFDSATGTRVRNFSSPQWDETDPPDILFAPDGRSLLRFDKRVIETDAVQPEADPKTPALWPLPWLNGQAVAVEIATGRERFRLPRDWFGYTARKLEWSRDGRLVARRGDAGGGVAVFDTLAGEWLWRRNAGQGEVTALAFSPDGRRLATAGADTTILIWALPALGKVRSALSDEQAWKQLADADAKAGFDAMRHFMSDPGAAAKWFAKRLRAPAPNPKAVAALLRELDDESFDVRAGATKALRRLGPMVSGDLAEAARKSPSLEVRRRCEALLRNSGEAPLPPEYLRCLRAIETLERIGTPAARGELKRLLTEKPAASLKAEVEAALERTKP